MLDQQSESAEGPEERRQRRLWPQFSVLLIGIAGIALIILMCVVVAALAYLRS